ncbi:hypothetical protein D3C81_2056720 [compost metagenome]
MDVDAEDAGRMAGQGIRRLAAARQPQMVRHAVGLQRMKALQVQQCVQGVGAGRITLRDGREVGRDAGQDGRLRA